MMPLVFSLWKEVMESPTTQTNKLVAIGSLLQVYSALLGMADEDFQELTDGLGEMYPGPLPDGYSEEILEHYKGSKKHD